MKFVTWCPMAYAENSGGIMALHNLADNLARLGYDSLITTCNAKPGAQYGVITDKEAMQMDEDTTIYIYPESIDGNPLAGKHIIRWLLNTPGKVKAFDGTGTYSPYEHVYKFADIFKAHDESKVNGLLYVLDGKTHIYYRTNATRAGTCYLVKKGKNTGLHPHNATAIDAIEASGNHHEMARIFNSHRVFICYDDACFSATQAALCGCVVIVIPQSGLTPEQWRGKYAANKYGIAYGYADLAHALETTGNVKSNLLQLEQDGLNTIKQFVEDCKKIIKATI